MSSDATSSDEENLAAYAGVAVSGETVKAHAVTAGEKAAKVPIPLLPESVPAIPWLLIYTATAAWFWHCDVLLI